MGGHFPFVYFCGGGVPNSNFVMISVCVRMSIDADKLRVSINLNMTELVL